MENKEKASICQRSRKVEKGSEFFPFSYSWVRNDNAVMDYESLCTKFATNKKTVYMLESKRAKLVGQGKITFYKNKMWRTIDITTGEITVG